MALDEQTSILIDELGQLRNSAVVSKAAGETVITAGEEGESMFLIQDGKVEILSDGVVLDVVGPGGVIGEMALVDGSLRSATVNARTAVDLVPISKANFELLIRRHPEFGLHVMKIMSLRLRLMNERLRSEETVATQLEVFLDTDSSQVALEVR